MSSVASPSFVPSYRRQKSKGRADRAFVEISKGNRVYLGEFNSPESKQEYDRVIAGWLSGGRSAGAVVTDPAKVNEKTVIEIIELFWAHAKKTYRKSDGSTTQYFEDIRYPMLIKGATAWKPIRTNCAS